MTLCKNREAIPRKRQQSVVVGRRMIRSRSSIFRPKQALSFRQHNVARPAKSRSTFEREHFRVVAGRASAHNRVTQVGIGAIEQGVDTVDPGVVQARQRALGERAENQVNLLRPAMSASEQKPAEADLGVVVWQALGNTADISHSESPLLSSAWTWASCCC